MATHCPAALTLLDPLAALACGDWWLALQGTSLNSATSQPTLVSHSRLRPLGRGGPPAVVTPSKSSANATHCPPGLLELSVPEPPLGFLRSDTSGFSLWLAPSASRGAPLPCSAWHTADEQGGWMVLDGDKHRQHQSQGAHRVMFSMMVRPGVGVSVPGKLEARLDRRSSHSLGCRSALTNPLPPYSRLHLTFTPASLPRLPSPGWEALQARFMSTGPVLPSHARERRPYLHGSLQLAPLGGPQGHGHPIQAEAQLPDHAVAGESVAGPQGQRQRGCRELLLRQGERQAFLPRGAQLALLERRLGLHGAHAVGHAALDVAVTASVVVAGHSCSQGETGTDAGGSSAHGEARMALL